MGISPIFELRNCQLVFFLMDENGVHPELMAIERKTHPIGVCAFDQMV
jgi:hypothetical protein